MPKKKAVEGSDGLVTPIDHYSGADASNMAKKSLKERGKDVRGMPDEWDEKNIQRLLDSYEMAYPGRLKRMAEDQIVERKLSARNEYGEVSADSAMRLAMWMPADLAAAMEHVYPSIWTDKKHLTWFLRHFPIFKAAEKI